MKKLILLLGVLCLSATLASARGIPIPFGKQEKLKVVYDLPDSTTYADEEGNFFDIASLHEEYNIAWIFPLWITQEPKLVLMKTGVDDEYWDIPEETLNAIIEENKLDKEELLSLGFYTRYGGKIVFGIFILFCIWGMIPSKKKDDDDDRVEATEV